MNGADFILPACILAGALVAAAPSLTGVVSAINELAAAVRDVATAIRETKGGK